VPGEEITALNSVLRLTGDSVLGLVDAENEELPEKKRKDFTGRLMVQLFLFGIVVISTARICCSWFNRRKLIKRREKINGRCFRWVGVSVLDARVNARVDLHLCC
jgi:hypothetical protein